LWENSLYVTFITVFLSDYIVQNVYIVQMNPSVLSSVDDTSVLHYKG